MIALALRYWRAFALAALLALLGVQTVRVAGLKQESAEVARAHAEATQRAEQAQRIEETRRQAAVDKEASDAQARIAQLETDVAAARDSADRLRSAVSTAVRRARTDPKPAATSPGEPDSDPLGVLAFVLGRATARSEIVERYADAIRIAGTTCERSGDAVQPAGREAP